MLRCIAGSASEKAARLETQFDPGAEMASGAGNQVIGLSHGAPFRHSLKSRQLPLVPFGHPAWHRQSPQPRQGNQLTYLTPLDRQE
jgi:hypothetical protein